MQVSCHGNYDTWVIMVITDIAINQSVMMLCQTGKIVVLVYGLPRRQEINWKPPQNPANASEARQK